MKNLIKNFYISLLFIFPVIFLISFNCSTEKIDLGLAYSKDPDSNKVLHTEFGKIPVNQFAVILKEGYGKKEADEIAQEYGGTVVGEIEFINLFQIENNFSKEEELVKAITEISKKEGVENALINGAVYADDIESISCDPLDDEVYKKDSMGAAYNMINLKEAWYYIKASGLDLNDVKVGVNDSKLGGLSEEIYGDVKIAGNDAEDVTNTTNSNHSNGVINIIGADSKNGGTSGVASVLGNKLNINLINISKKKKYSETISDPNNIFQYQYKDKSYTINTLVDFKRQIESGSKIINCSFGMDPDDSDEMREIYTCYKKFFEKMAVEHPDVIFIKSAGNQGTGISSSNREMCDNLPNVISVGALDVNGNPADYSNYSKNPGDGSLTLSACGYNATETTKDGILRDQGTSYSAPQVTGVIALMKSLNPELSAARIKDILMETASKTVNGKKVDPKMGAGCLNAADAVFWVIKDLWAQKGLKPNPLTKEYLLNLSSLELSATGGPNDFIVTATIKGAGEKGATFSIDVTGSNYVLKGEQMQSLKTAGSVSWDITLGENSEGVTVKVKRLDTDRCAFVVLGGEIKAEDLVGQWDGTVVLTGWSSPNALIKQYSAKVIDPEVGKPKSLTLDITFIDENNVGIALSVKNGKPIPAKTFSFEKEKLHSEFYFDVHNYTYDAVVEKQGNKLKLKGTWSTVTYNKTVYMNGTWEAELNKK